MLFPWYHAFSLFIAAGSSHLVSGHFPWHTWDFFFLFLLFLAKNKIPTCAKESALIPDVRNLQQTSNQNTQYSSRIQNHFYSNRKPLDWLLPQVCQGLWEACSSINCAVEKWCFYMDTCYWACIWQDETSYVNYTRSSYAQIFQALHY